MKETIIFTSVGITFTGQHRAEGAELSARTLSDYLSGLTGKSSLIVLSNVAIRSFFIWAKDRVWWNLIVIPANYRAMRRLR